MGLGGNERKERQMPGWLYNLMVFAGLLAVMLPMALLARAPRPYPMPVAHAAPPYSGWDVRAMPFWAFRLADARKEDLANLERVVRLDARRWVAENEHITFLRVETKWNHSVTPRIRSSAVDDVMVFTATVYYLEEEK